MSRRTDDRRTSPNVVVDVSLRDAARDKDLHLRVTYPAAGGTLPVIVFSPHSGGCKEHYAPLMEHWASRGYACVQPDHSDAGRTGRDVLDFSNRWERVADMTFVIDRLPQIQAVLADARVELDPDRIGGAGNLYGADTVQLAAGMKVYPPEGPPIGGARDRRLRAIVVLTGQGRGQGLTEMSWGSLELPMLVVAGTLQPSRRTGNDPEWRTEPFRSSPAGDKYLLRVQGLGHALAGLAIPPREADERLAGIVLTATTAFWDAYLREDRDARALLENKGLAQDGVVFEVK